MESDRKLELYQEKKQRSIETSNYPLDSLSIGDFAVLKMNKLILLPILVGIIIEIPLDLILIPIFREFQLYGTDPLMFLEVLKILIIRLLILIWFLKMLQDTITKTNFNPRDTQNLSQFDTPLKSLKKSFINYPKILIITFLVILFLMGLFYLSNKLFSLMFPAVDGHRTSTTFSNFMEILFPIFLIVITIYIVMVYIHWMILTVFNENQLKQSFWDSMVYVKENLRKMLNILMIPIVLSIGISIAMQIINMDWLNNVFSILMYYFSMIFVALVYGRNYSKIES